MGVLLHDALLLALPVLLALVGALFIFAHASCERDRHLDAAAGEVQVERHERVARALRLADELHDLAAVHEELSRAVRLKRHVRAGLVRRRHVGVAEEELAVAHVDVREVDLGAGGANALDFPALEHDAGLELFFDRIVVAGALVLNECHDVSLVLLYCVLLILVVLLPYGRRPFRANCTAILYCKAFYAAPKPFGHGRGRLFERGDHACGSVVRE